MAPIKFQRPNYPDNRKAARPWSDEDVARLIHMREVQCLPWSVMDEALGRSKGGSQLKYGLVRKLRQPSPDMGRGHAGSGRAIPSPEQLAEREQRSAAANRMTPTSIFFGDPPPGYSALDRRGGPDAPRT